MMSHDRPAMFRYVSPTGEVIATGSLDFLNRQLEVHRTAEGAIKAAALAADTSIKARNDAVAAREVAQTNREIRSFANSVAKVGARLDALEKARADAEEQAKAKAIRDALNAAPDPDDPQGRPRGQQDDLLPPSSFGPSQNEDKRQLAEVEEAIEKNRDDQGDLPVELLKHAPPQPGNYQTLDRPPRQIPQPIAVSLASADGLGREDFVCGRDFRKWKRQQQSRSWK
jgi:hypothetical protein